MIRSELCKIAEMSAPTFNSHRRNGDLPFDIQQFEAADGAGRTWARFTVHEAARMIAARMLVASQGVTWSEAARILRSPNIRVGEGGAGNYPFDKAGVHIAQVAFRNADTDGAPEWMDAQSIYQGSLPEIGAAAARIAEAYSTKRTEPVVVASIVSVNLSHAYTLAFRRAAAEGIALDVEAKGDAESEA